MVFSIVKNFITGFFYGNDEEQQADDINENEEELLRKITEGEENEVFVQHVPSTRSDFKSPDNDDVIKCLRKTGKVTFLNAEYGLINNDLLFYVNRDVAEGVTVKLNDVVAYLAYQATANQAERVQKVLGLASNLVSWDEKPADGQPDVVVIPKHGGEEVIVMQAINRILNGQVTKRREREFFITPLNLWVDLDKVEIDHSTPFVPVEGDFLSLGAKVTIDEEVTDLTGEIVEIKIIRPLRYKSDIGKVTLWKPMQRNEGEGAIENDTYFNQELCERGYIPSLGDEVLYDKIESEQGDYRWRAISVSPIDVQKNSEDATKVNEMERLLRDKNGIGIVGVTDFGEIRLNESKELILEVKNFGKANQTLLRCRFNGRKQSSQIALKSPGLDDSFQLKPGDSLKFVFECKGRFVGFSSELFVFTFRGFRIGRNLEMNILVERDLNQLLPTDVKTHYKKNFHLQRQNIMKSLDKETTTRTYGAKPKNAPKFIKGERPGRYKTPEKLYNIVLGNTGLPKPQQKIMSDLENYAPFLRGELHPTNYSDWFHLLLHLEELTVRIELRRFDMEDKTLLRRGDYLVLNVPGLQEQRPSLIIGDKVIVSQPWRDTESQEHVGHIHEIRQSEVLMKFHPSFQDEYDESNCNVYFETNMSNIQKAHDAVNRAMRKLGSKWLFPSSVQEKQPQLVFETIEDFVEPVNEPQAGPSSEKPPVENGVSENGIDLDEEQRHAEESLQEKKVEPEYDVDEEGFLIPRVKENAEVKTVKTEATKPESVEDKKLKVKKRKLIWFNKDLNYQQKASVTNVLKGQGRPLPYIIFGPPGTGKTITLVETILQIYTLLPESRLLVGTPSNSSADLLCERIIDAGVLQPGELVRIMAYHRACDGNIPEKMLPYCTTTDLRDDKGDIEMFVQPENGLKQSSLSQLVGRHRITVGTCSALGSLHYMGFPPDHFTHIIVDEAGQSLEPEILIPISFLNTQKGQVVLAGDPEQLGPICISKVAEEYGLGNSLLQRFVKHFPYTRDHAGFPNTNGYDPRFITRLCINYRSIPEILDLPSQLFYNSELVPTVSSTDSYEFELCKKFNEISNIRESPTSIIFHGVRGQNHQEHDNPSWYNPQEIWQCIHYLKRSYSIGLTADDCGIITPYKKQVQKLRHLLTELEIPVPKIGTVEDFQGQERYVIILSAVRSSLTYIGNDIKHSLGFVASPRRLNVALTRARAILIIVGNPHLLSTDPYWRSALLYCIKNNSYLGCDMPNNLETETIENVIETTNETANETSSETASTIE